MTEDSQTREIREFVNEKPHRYHDLIKGLFVETTVYERDYMSKHGFGFKIGFLFPKREMRSFSPKDIASNLRRYEIIRGVAESESLDLMEVRNINNVDRGISYRETSSLDELGIGYLDREKIHGRTIQKEIDRLFSAYDNILEKLAEE